MITQATIIRAPAKLSSRVRGEGQGQGQGHGQGQGQGQGQDVSSGGSRMGSGGWW